MKKLLYAFVLLVFSCCTNENVTDVNTTAEFCNYAAVDVIISETPMEQITYNSRKLMVQRYEDYYILEGDILIPIDSVTNRSVGRTTGLWPDNVIVFEIDPNVSNQSRIFGAMLHWETTTNIRFVQRTSESDYVYFKDSDSGCASYIGKTGGRQDIWLSDACSIGNTIHEIGHAAGLFHEQSRNDRDNYVTVLWDNIMDGKEQNFNKANQSGLPTTDITPTLDFGSIMMYSSYAFSKNNEPTLVKINGSTFGVQRNSLSVDDVKGINVLYPAQTPPEPEPDTDGDGIVDKDDKCPEEAGPVSNEGCPVEPEPTEPITPTEYVNGTCYEIAGEVVLRNNDTWYMKKGNEWMEVHLVDGEWKPVSGKKN